MVSEIKITKKMVYDDIKLIGATTIREYLEKGEYSKGTVFRAFGSWTKAIEEVFQIIKPQTQMLQCGYCNKEIRVTPSKLKKVNYCSSACANKAEPRRKKEGVCKSCNTEIYSSRTYCDPCFKKGVFSLKTIGELRAERQDAARFSYVRNHARKLMKNSGAIEECKNCGYNKHVQVCHIKDISDFTDETTVEVVNDLSNLLYLCPNCHWELDHGMLEKY